MNHVVIPDTQIRPGLGKKQLKHLEALANYLNDYQPEKVIMLGDWWDMPSLSKYELAGSKRAEGRRIQKDIDAGNKAMDSFMDAIDYWPEFHFLKGNHEERLDRLGSEDVRFEGLFEDSFSLDGWQVHDFLEIVPIDGVAYSHYFVNEFNGRPLSGTASNQLKKLGFSFTAGHKQILDVGRMERKVGGCIQGLVAGAFYSHDEHYKVQSNGHWRGIIHKHNVLDGRYDLQTIRLDSLVKEFT